MHQSSITAWLKKPVSVKKAEEPTSATVAPSSVPPPIPRISTEPTPPPAEPQKVKSEETSKFALPALPPNVELVPLTEDTMQGFKRLNALTLPISYPPAWYAESMTEPFHSITLIALWRAAPLDFTPSLPTERPRVVGAIRCCILPESILYIGTITLLAPYRSHGIASHLLHHIIAIATKEHGIKRVTAHVWEANEDGLGWYAKRGFKVMGKEDHYYSKLKPPGAVLVVKKIGVTDLLAGTGDG
jgi:ribosomal protein S18 acetylase RimI-like enzyme